MSTAADDLALELAERAPETTRSRLLTWQDPPPIAVTMRARPVEIADGRVVFEGEPGEEHYNPLGVVHGG